MSFDGRHDSDYEQAHGRVIQSALTLLLRKAAQDRAQRFCCRGGLRLYHADALGALGKFVTVPRSDARHRYYLQRLSHGWKGAVGLLIDLW